jgi:hypothetical protein
MSYVVAKNHIQLGIACGTATALSVQEMVPMTTSLLYTLRSTPYSDGISSLSAPILSNVGNGNIGPIQDMMVAGMTAAGQAIYLSGLPQSEGGGNFNVSNTVSNTPGVFQTTAEVSYRAYQWAYGWKGYAWLAALCALCAIASMVTLQGLFVKRLRFDASDFAQTLFIALGSGFEPPNNTCSGETPSKVNRQHLHYTVLGDRLVFRPGMPDTVHTVRPNGASRYGN